ncbi:MAG: peptidylprolyl isomerase [Planctomycetota bacterium]|nr:MAG: peptidylprolyl isomerase [Planctomycetota bacterium]
MPRALLRTTKGDIEVELFENQAPETVANFIYLAESGFYDHHLFHRVIQHFMAQTGDPNGDGTGGPGYSIYDEAGRPDHRKFFRGSLGMAMTAQPNSGGSQFFITFLPTFDLNGQYTVFGRVTRGIEVLSNLRRVDPDAKDKKEEDKDVPLDELIEVIILSKRNHEYLPHKVEN